MINKILMLIERKAARFQGKGWGTGTVAKEFASARSLLSNDAVKLCVDIGGNKGIYSEEIVRSCPDSKVVIFEPAGSNIKILNNKFSDNPKITIERFGVSSESGSATLFSNKDGSGLASLTKRRLDHFGINFDCTESIETVRFEDYWIHKLNRQNIDVCKIDIEGHELDALNGFGEALRHINVIQFEFGGCNIDTRTYFQDFWYFFQQENFEIYRITPFGKVKIEKYSEFDEAFSTTNYLAKRVS